MYSKMLSAAAARSFALPVLHRQRECSRRMWSRLSPRARLEDVYLIEGRWWSRRLWWYRLSSYPHQWFAALVSAGTRDIRRCVIL